MLCPDLAFLPKANSLFHQSQEVTLASPNHSPSFEDVCQGATWSMPHTFIKHYKADALASRDEAFARRVYHADILHTGSSLL